MAQRTQAAPKKAGKKKTVKKKAGKRKAAKKKAAGKRGSTHRIFIVSGGSGASGTQLVETVLAQFPGVRFDVSTKTRVRDKSGVEGIVRKAASEKATVVHTLVDGGIREALIELCRDKGVAQVDLMGSLIDRLKGVSGQEPEGRPGLYRMLRVEYFKRMAAIEFAVSHDDGQRPEEIPSAEIVLLGLSRCGKTPLSMYLAVHGWKVANIPIVEGLELPEEIRKVPRRRVVCLTIDYGHLLAHRKSREGRMGRRGAGGSYASASAVMEELEYARKVCRRGGFRTVNVTGKPIESIAEEIIELLEEDQEGR